MSALAELMALEKSANALARAWRAGAIPKAQKILGLGEPTADGIRNLRAAMASGPRGRMLPIMDALEAPDNSTWVREFSTLTPSRRRQYRVSIRHPGVWNEQTVSNSPAYPRERSLFGRLDDLPGFMHPLVNLFRSRIRQQTGRPETYRDIRTTGSFAKWHKERGKAKRPNAGQDAIASGMWGEKPSDLHAVLAGIGPHYSPFRHRVTSARDMPMITAHEKGHADHFHKIMHDPFAANRDMYLARLRINKALSGGDYPEYVRDGDMFLSQLDRNGTEPKELIAQMYAARGNSALAEQIRNSTRDAVSRHNQMPADSRYLSDGDLRRTKDRAARLREMYPNSGLDSAIEHLATNYQFAP